MYTLYPTRYLFIICWALHVGDIYKLCRLRWVVMGAIASQITSPTIVYSTVYSDADQRKHQSSASLAFVRGHSPGTGEFSAQMANNAEKVSIWWRHHVNGYIGFSCLPVSMNNLRELTLNWATAFYIYHYIAQFIIFHVMAWIIYMYVG